jgi:hypothetical protein
MISEAELIEIEARAEMLADVPGDVVDVVAESLKDRDDWREGTKAMEAQLGRIALDIERLIGEVRAAGRVAA